MFPLRNPVRTESDGMSGTLANGGMIQLFTRAVAPSAVKIGSPWGARTGGPFGPSGKGGPKAGNGRGLILNLNASPEPRPVTRFAPPLSKALTTSAESASGEIVA